VEEMTGTEEITTPLSKTLTLSSFCFSFIYSLIFSLTFPLSKHPYSSSTQQADLFQCCQFLLHFSGLQGELSNRASCTYCTNNRWSYSPCCHLSHMDTWLSRLHPPLLPQPVLLVPPRTTLHHLHLCTDRSGPSWPPHGFHHNQ